MPIRPKKKAKDLVLSWIKDNQGIKTTTLHNKTYHKASVVKAAITILIKERKVVMIKDGKDRRLYTMEYALSNDIEIKPVVEKVIPKTEIELQQMFNQLLFQVAQ